MTEHVQTMFFFPAMLCGTQNFLTRIKPVPLAVKAQSLKIFLFIYGCTGPAAVWAFSCAERGLRSPSCGVQACHCNGFLLQSMVSRVRASVAVARGPVVVVLGSRAVAQ